MTRLIHTLAVQFTQPFGKLPVLPRGTQGNRRESGRGSAQGSGNDRACPRVIRPNAMPHDTALLAIGVIAPEFF
ncbi:hypothetical protein [Pontixanthobacter sp.]|uniref:hypothetical protein n=1 Tax=Pontixanthobacter sp. TaxID=2792078 RepID=UPI003C7B47DF